MTRRPPKPNSADPRDITIRELRAELDKYKEKASLNFFRFQHVEMLAGTQQWELQEAEEEVAGFIDVLLSLGCHLAPEGDVDSLAKFLPGDDVKSMFELIEVHLGAEYFASALDAGRECADAFASLSIEEHKETEDGADGAYKDRFYCSHPCTNSECFYLLTPAVYGGAMRAGRKVALGDYKTKQCGFEPKDAAEEEANIRALHSQIGGIPPLPAPS